MWLLQTLIAGAVLFSNIRWHWTPNGYLAALIAALTVWIVTVLPFKIYGWLLSWSFKLKARFRHE